MAFGVGFLAAAAAAVFAFLALAGRILDGEIRGGRAGGLILIGPAIFAASGVYALVRGIRAFSPWLAYRGAVSRGERRRDRADDLRDEPIVLLTFIAVLALAGSIAIAVTVALHPAMVQSIIAGLALLIESETLLVMLWLGAGGLVAQKLYFRRFTDADARGAAHGSL
jgi:hypothetical protein